MVTAETVAVAMTGFKPSSALDQARLSSLSIRLVVCLDLYLALAIIASFHVRKHQTVPAVDFFFRFYRLEFFAPSQFSVLYISTLCM